VAGRGGTPHEEEIFFKNSVTIALGLIQSEAILRPIGLALISRAFVQTSYKAVPD
jgi:hypothetical protein